MRDFTDLKLTLTDVIVTTDEALVQRTWREIEYCHDVLRAANAAHIKVY